jgi:hypothetical protein
VVSANKQIFNVRLAETKGQLDEVVVTAFGKKERKEGFGWFGNQY